MVYKYDEEHTLLSVGYDNASKQVTICGGNNGLWRLAELFEIWAEANVSGEDEHWYKMRPGIYALTLLYYDVGSSISVEVLSKEDIFYTLVGNRLQKTKKTKLVRITVNRDGCRRFATELINYLSNPSEGLTEVVFTGKMLAEPFPTLRLKFDSTLDA